MAQLYKFMDDRGTPLNRNPTIANRDIDLYRLFRVSINLTVDQTPTQDIYNFMNTKVIC